MYIFFLINCELKTPSVEIACLLGIQNDIQAVRYNCSPLKHLFDFHYKSLLTWYFNKSVERYYPLRKQVHNSPVHLDLENDLILCCIFFKNVKKNTSGGLILSLEKSGLIPYSNILQKELCSEKHKLRNNEFWTCVFRYINIFYKLLEYGIKPNFSKDRIRPQLIIFFLHFWKKNMTGSSANFLRPEPNGKGWYSILFYQPH